MAFKKKAQIALAEKLIEDSNLEQILDERESVKEGLGEVRGEFAEVDRKARGVIEAKGLEEGAYRCGAFVINIGHEDAKDVSFTRKGGTRTRIKHLGNGSA